MHTLNMYEKENYYPQYLPHYGANYQFASIDLAPSSYKNSYHIHVCERDPPTGAFKADTDIIFTFH